MLDTALIQKNLYSKCVDSLDSLGKHGSVPLSKHGFRFHSSEIEILEHAYLRRRGRTPNRHECEQFAQAFNNSEPRRKKNTHGWQARWPQVNAKQIKTWFENKRQKDKREKFISDPGAMKELDKPIAKLATSMDCERWVSIELLGPKDDALPYLPPLNQTLDKLHGGENHPGGDREGALGLGNASEAGKDWKIKQSYNIRDWLRHHICNDEVDRLPLVEVPVNPTSEANKGQHLQLQQHQHFAQNIAQIKQQQLIRGDEGLHSQMQHPQSHLMRSMEPPSMEEAIMREASLTAGQTPMVPYSFLPQQQTGGHPEVSYGVHPELHGVHHAEAFPQAQGAHVAQAGLQHPLGNPSVNMYDAFEVLRSLENPSGAFFNMKVPTS